LRIAVLRKGRANLAFINASAHAQRYDSREKMRQITERTKKILNKLYQPKSFFGRFGSKKKDTCDLLAMIQDCGEPAVIPDILSLVFSRDNNVSRKAAKVIDFLMKSITAKDLIWLEHYRGFNATTILILLNPFIPYSPIENWRIR